MTQQQDKTIEQIKSWLFPLLLAVLGGLLQMQYSGISDQLDNLNNTIQKIDKEAVVNARDGQYLQKKIEEHERWLDDLDQQNHTLKYALYKCVYGIR